MPDPYVFAILLTLLVAVLNFFIIPEASVDGIIDAWYQGVWGSQNIFVFTLQMTLILVTGTTLAKAPLIAMMLQKLASYPRNQVEAAILCFLTGAIASLINWGLGLVVGTLLAIEIVKRMEEVDFAYLVAAAYMGFIVWTSGFSSSIALANADSGSALNIIYRMTGQTVPMRHSIFSTYNLIAVAATLVIFPLMLRLIAPEKIKPIDRAFLHKDIPKETSRPKHIAEKLENAWILNVIFVAVGSYQFFFLRTGPVTINSVILIFGILGLLLHWTPIRYARAFTDSAKVSGSLLLQYPLYGGIMALIAYAPHAHIDPLHTVLAQKMIDAATPATLPFLNFLSSCIITMFVPSGGGHWAVQGPVSIQAAIALGESSPAYLGKISMSVAFGEGVFNMIQPFWALPVLSLAGLNIRDIMGYCTVALIAGFCTFGAALIFS